MSSTPGFNTGDQPSATQWNAYFGAKQDVSFANYAAVRANTTPETDLFVLGFATPDDGGQGWFSFASGDTTSADNGGTILVDANGRRFYRQFSGVINTKWFGAYGDDSHDDTTAIQTSINVAIATGNNLYTPHGTYRTSAQLNVGANLPTANLVGWGWSGAGPGDSQLNPAMGTTFVYQGTSGSPITAICSVNVQAGNRTRVSDMSFYGKFSRSAQYGLLENSTEFSQRRFENISIGRQPGHDPFGPVVAFGILVGTGANGEFTIYDRCTAGESDTWFYCNAGQAFQPIFQNCTGGPNPGGVWFQFAATGIGALISGFNGTAAQTSGVSNSTFILDQGIASSLTVIGGRIEHVTCLYNGGGNAAAIAFKSMDVTTDLDPTNVACTTSGMVTISAGGTGSVTFSDIIFSGANSKCTFPLKMFGSGGVNSKVRFKDCYFNAFARPPYPTGLSGGTWQEVSFENCYMGWNGNSNPITKILNVDRSWRTGNTSAGRRQVDNDDAWLLAGVQENLITNSQISTTTGFTVTPASGWTASSPGTLRIDDWNSSGGQASSSPFARVLTLTSGQTLIQTISSTDLSSSAVAKYSLSSSFACLTWQLMVRRVGTSGSGAITNGVTFTLSESASGTILDNINYTAGQGNEPKLVTLAANVQQYSTPTFPVLTIAAGAPGNLILEIDWQYFSIQLKPSFAPVTAPATYTNLFAGVTESLNIWDRLVIPYKTDLYGMSATRPLPNLVTDTYRSSTTGQLTAYSAFASGGLGAWTQEPVTFYSSAVPSSGTWNFKDIAYHTAPASGTPMGWICVASGSPGTWRPWGIIN